MATVSFTRNMKLNKRESEKLLEFLEEPAKVDYKVTTPPATEATKADLDRLFGNK